MAVTELPIFHSMMGHIAAGAVAGQQQASQEADADRQRNEEMALRVGPLAQNMQSQYVDQQQAPWAALAPHLAGFTPGSQAQILQHLGQQPTGVAPGVTGLMSAFPAGEAPGDLLRQLAPGATPGAPGTPGGAFPYGLPQPVPPAGAPQVPPAATAGLMGGVVEGGLVAPGGVAPPTAGQTTFTGPGGVSLTLGPDAKQQNALRSEVARIAPRFEAKELPPDVRDRVKGLIGTANQQIAAGDLEGARLTVSQLQQAEADVGPQLKAGARTNYLGNVNRYDKLTDRFRRGRLTPEGALAGLTQLREIETQTEALREKNPEFPAGTTLLEPYADQIDQSGAQFKEANALRQKPSRTPEEEQHLKDLDKSWQGTSQSLYDNLKYGVPPERRGAILGQVRQWMTQLPPDQRTPENVAALLERNGETGMAQLVRERGLNFGGAEAEKETEGLLKALPGIMRPGTPPPVRQAFADRIRIQSTLTGHPVALDPGQLIRPDPRDIKGTAAWQAWNDQHQKSLLQLDRLRAQNAAEIKGNKWQSSVLDVDLKQASLDQKMGRLPDPALARNIAVKEMSKRQHEADQAHQDFAKFVSVNSAIDKTSFDPSAWLRDHPVKFDAQGNIVSGGDFEKILDFSGKPDKDTAQGVKLYARWRNKVEAQDAFFKRLGGRLPKDTPNTGTPQPKPQPKPKTGAGGSTGPIVQQQRQTYWNGLKAAGATDHEANLLMQHRFPGTAP